MGIFPVGVFLLNDEIAVEVINHAGANGIKCPGDIGVLGFDGLSIGQYSYPRLNSVSFPVRDVGNKTAKILIDILEGKKIRKNSLVIEAVISDGHSC
jgi:DNA-binding LacI/PurR family transcriptional regulator